MMVKMMDSDWDFQSLGEMREMYLDILAKGVS